MGFDLDQLLASASRASDAPLAGTNKIGVAYAAPIISTDENGDGNEYFAPDEGAGYILEVNGLPAGATIVAVWYTLLQGVGFSLEQQLDGFNLIDVSKHGARQVNLSVIGIPGTSRRLRIRIHALYVTA